MHGHRTSSYRKQGHIYSPERNFTFYAKIQCKNMPQKVYETKSEAKYITPKFGYKICPQKFTPLKLDGKI